MEVVRMLCEAGADKDTAQQDGVTRLEVVRMLCEAGADKDKAKHNGASPLFIASQEGRLEVARMLCDAGADEDTGQRHTLVHCVAGGVLRG